jgi:hydrogenase maturation protease
MMCINSELKTQHSKLTLVIGYGNDLRGDDAVGPLAATAVAAWDMPDVQGIAVHQLMPELAEALATADLAIFVDACAPVPLAGEAFVSVHPIEPVTVDSAIGHTGDPRALLALTTALYGRCPAAWSITVPARNFAFGAELSPDAERGLAAALQQIADLLANATYAINQPQVRKGHNVIGVGALSACFVARERNNRG